MWHSHEIPPRGQLLQNKCVSNLEHGDIQCMVYWKKGTGSFIQEGGMYLPQHLRHSNLSLDCAY